MKNKIVLITVILVFFISLIPLEFAQAQTYPTEAAQVLTPSDIEFGLISEHELWLKSGSRLYYTQDGGNQWSEITPETGLIDPYLLISFPTSDLGFALYLTQTETRIELEIVKTSTQGAEWSLVLGDLQEKINQQYYQPFGEIQMQWLDERNAMVLVKEFSSSNFSIGTLFVSKDGGESWSAKQVPIAEKFVFLDTQVGFMLNPSSSESLYRTLDGGESWSLFGLEMPQDFQENHIEVDLPLSTQDKRVFLPVNITAEGESDYKALVKIDPITSSKNPLNSESLEFIPLLIQDRAKQVSTITYDQIREVRTQDAKNIWVGVTGGECNTLLGEDDTIVLNCDTSWEMLRSESGGLNWENMTLPEGIGRINQTSSTLMELPVPTNEVTPKDVDLNTNEWVQNFTGHAFDKCEVPTLSQLQSWRTSSPYRAVNLYIGGISKFCSNLPITASYIQSIYRQGWKLILTWVGHQAPCTTFKYPFPYNVTDAYQYGVNNANQANARMRDLNLSNSDGSGNIIYLDLEHFGYTPNCSAAARAYLNGWNTRLSQLGIATALYSTSSSITANSFFDLDVQLDAVWVAEWYRTPGFRPDETVWDLRYLSNEYWTNNQRILQYSGGHNETWGGVTMNIDSNVAEGKVSVPFGADLTPPVTTAQINGTFGYENWYKTPVEVTLTATDNSVGVRYTYYKIDDGVWTLYRGPFLVSGSGLISLRYLSVDKVDNWEGPKITTFKVDTVPPVLSPLTRVGCLAYNGIPQRWCNNAYFVWDHAVDTGVGIPASKVYQYYWGTNPQGTSSTYTFGRWFDPDPIPMRTPYYLRLRAQDIHGNWSAWKTMFTLIYDPTAKDPIWMPVMFK